MLRAVLTGALVALTLPFVWPWAPETLVDPAGRLELLSLVALAPLLSAVDGRRTRRAFLLGWLAGAVAFAMVFYWINIAMTTFGGLPHAASIPTLGLLVAYCALYWGAAVGVAVHARARLGWPLWVTLPPAWVGTELLRNYMFSGYPWGNLGYSLVRTELLAQVASVGGVYLLAGLVVLSNAVVHEVVRWLLAGRPESGRRAVVRGAAVAGAALVLSLGWGGYRLRAIARADEAAPRVKVALVQGNIDQRIKNRRGKYADFILRSYVPLSAEEAEEDADLVIWPEAAYPSSFRELPVDFASLEPLAPLRGVGRAHYLLSGTTLRRDADRRVLTNSAWLVRNDLTTVARYDKAHLVPFGEYVPLDWLIPVDKIVPGLGTFEPGEGLPVLTADLPDGPLRLGEMICYDGIFPEIARSYGRRDVGLLVNTTNDAWYGHSSAPHQFLHIVAMRAIENGRWVARAANTGISAFIDPAGRVVDRTGIGLVRADADRLDISQQVPPVTLMRRVPVLSGRTVYALMGDLYAWACLLFACLALGLAIVKNPRRWYTGPDADDGGTHLPAGGSREQARSAPEASLTSTPSEPGSET